MKRINKKSLKWKRKKTQMESTKVDSVKAHKRYLLKRIIIMNGISVLILLLTYAWMIFFLANVNSIWDLFRSDTYQSNTEKVAPTPPYLSPISEATKESTIDITGQTEAGQKVVLYVDNSKVDETIADATGNFSFTGIQTGIFPRKIFVRAISDSGVESENSTEYTVVRDTEAPILEITNPKEKELDYSATGHSFEITGKTEPGTTVSVNDQIAVVDSDGNFTTSYRLKKGGNELIITATDKAGNQTEEKVFVNFHKIE